MNYCLKYFHHSFYFMKWKVELCDTFSSWRRRKETNPKLVLETHCLSQVCVSRKDDLNGHCHKIYIREYLETVNVKQFCHIFYIYIHLFSVNFFQTLEWCATTTRNFTKRSFRIKKYLIKRKKSWKNLRKLWMYWTSLFFGGKPRER